MCGRYLLKLYRDYVFHQCEDDDTPVVDFGAIVQSLNKLDVGTSERITLISRDEQTILIVSYADLKACAERSFGELLQQGNYVAVSRRPPFSFPSCLSQKYQHVNAQSPATHLLGHD